MASQLLVATRKGLFTLSKQSGQWAINQRNFLGEPVSMLTQGSDSNTLYAALNLGHFGTKVHRSKDAGQTWQEVAAPSYENIAPDKEGSDAPSLKQIWSMEVSSNGTLWAGTIPGGLFRSDDEGESWQLNEPLWNHPLRKDWFGGGYDEPGIHSICLDPRNHEHIAIGVSCGGVWLSKDNGQSWIVSCEGMAADYLPPEIKDNPAMQDPHLLVQCKNAPEHFWIQHHCGIFKSSDGCASWQEVKTQPSSFGFAVAVHPDNPDHAWFIPAIKDEKRYPVDGKFLVNKTTDGGKTFTQQIDGLPQQESYDLVYRHALGIDRSGEVLAMGSTTGNLWITENGGEQWTELSSNLPPVYALTFIR